MPSQDKAQITSPETHICSWRKQIPYTNREFPQPLYRSRCHCGRVQFSVSTLPLDAKLCHCRECRVLHGAPMQHAAIFKKKNVKFDEDSLDHLEFYASGQSSAPGKGADGKIPGLP